MLCAGFGFGLVAVFQWVDAFVLRDYFGICLSTVLGLGLILDLF